MGSDCDLKAIGRKNCAGRWMAGVMGPARLPSQGRNGACLAFLIIETVRRRVAMKNRVATAGAASALILVLAGCVRSPDVPPEQPSVLTPASGTSQGTLGPRTSRCAENFAIFDRDRDRRVSLEELADRPEPGINPDLFFRARDRDFDGYLIESEFCVRLGVTLPDRPFPE
jgi:hypothetical protein